LETGATGAKDKSGGKKGHREWVNKGTKEGSKSRQSPKPHKRKIDSKTKNSNGDKTVVEGLPQTKRED